MKRTVEGGQIDASVVCFTDFVPIAYLPSDKSLGYCHSSAIADWALEQILVQSHYWIIPEGQRPSAHQVASHER